MDSASTSARLSSVGGVLTIALFTTLTALALTNCPLPWSAGLLLAAIYMLVIAMRSKRKATAVLTANAAAVVVAIALFEGYLGIQQRQGDGTRMEGTVDDGTQPDDRLGYAPLKNSHLTARKFYGDTVLYDVVYSIGPDGLRIAPPSDREPIECIVFFGDSISFGEGVQDDGTFPYQLGRKAAGRYAIYNFAYSGYGPHQMLANLHAGRVDELVRCEPTNFIYLAILEHIPRVAGLAAWDRHGPRFRLNSTGSVSRDGHFDDPPRLFGQWPLPRSTYTLLGKFLTWQRFFGRARNVNEKDLALFLAVVRESAAFTRQHYPRSKFHLILWDGREDERFAVIDKDLSKSGTVIHKLTSVVPDFASNWLPYVLSAHDLHPNPLLHERLADYLLKQLSGSPR